MKEAHGFKLEREQFVKEYDSTVLLYKHEKTGEHTLCQLLVRPWRLLSSLFPRPPSFTADVALLLPDCCCRCCLPGWAQVLR